MTELQPASENGAAQFSEGADAAQATEKPPSAQRREQRAALLIEDGDGGGGSILARACAGGGAAVASEAAPPAARGAALEQRRGARGVGAAANTIAFMCAAGPLASRRVVARARRARGFGRTHETGGVGVCAADAELTSFPALGGAALPWGARAARRGVDDGARGGAAGRATLAVQFATYYRRRWRYPFGSVRPAVRARSASGSGSSSSPSSRCR